MAMANELVDTGAGAAGATTGAGTGTEAGDLEDVLLELLGAPPSPEQLAGFQGNQLLMGLIKQYAQLRKTAAQVQADMAFLQQSAPPAKLGQGYFWDPPNPEYAPYQKQAAAATARLSRYYTGGNPLGAETAAYKALATQGASLQQRILTQVGAVEAARTKAQAAPSVIDVPTGKPGETQDSVWDPTLNDGKGGLRPVLGPEGKPVPTKQGSVPTTPAPRVEEGTQSWEPRELTLADGRKVWYQVPMRARKDGSWEPDTSRRPQPMEGMPSGATEVTILDGVPNTRTGPNGSFVPVPGYVKPPLFRADAQGRGYTSTDDGRTWQPSGGLPGTPQTMTSGGVVYPLDEYGLPIADRGVRLPQGAQPQTVEGYLVEVDPVTKQVTRTDLYTPEQRARLERTQGLTEQAAQATLARSQQLADPVAEYQRQVGVLQQDATQYRDGLNDRILRGELSVEDANRQFNGWWGTNVEQKLQPYQTMATAAYRREQNEYQQAQAAEQARVDAINRQREQVAQQAGETARQQLMTLAPQGRSPEFLGQLAQNVSTIGQPIPAGQKTGMRFSPESLSLDAVRASQPSLAGVGQAAVARALATISPAAAQSVGAPPPQVPGLPQFQDFMNRSPFQIPNPSLPVPGRAALDLGNAGNAALVGLPLQPGYAATQYQGGRVEAPWQIPG